MLKSCNSLINNKLEPFDRLEVNFQEAIEEKLRREKWQSG